MSGVQLSIETRHGSRRTTTRRLYPGDRSLHARSEQDRAIRPPTPSASVRRICDYDRSATDCRYAHELAAGEVSDVLCIPRPEWKTRAFSAFQLHRSERIH